MFTGSTPREGRRGTRADPRRTAGAASPQSGAVSRCAWVETLEGRWLLAGAVPAEWQSAAPWTAVAGGRRTPSSTLTSPTVAAGAAAGTGSITGQVFQDNNGNGVFDGGEPTLNGVTVYLDLDASSSLTAGDPSVLTAGSGNYSFVGLNDATYSVGQALPANMVRTNGPFLSAAVAGGGAVTGRNHANFPTQFDGSIGSDFWTFRIDPGDPTRLLIAETKLAVPTNYAVAKALISAITLNANTGDDMITIDQSNGAVVPNISFNIDGGSQSTVAADRILVTGSASAGDVVGLKNLDVGSGDGSIATRAVERVTVNGNGGADTLTLGRSLTVEVTYDGGGGTGDSLAYTGTDNADVVTLQSASLSAATLSVSHSNVEAVVLNAAAGADTIQYQSASASTAVTVNGGDGNDVLNINAAPPSPVVFNGGLDLAFTDTLNVNAGAYTFAIDAAAGTANLAVNVGAAGTVNFDATQHLASLTVAGGAAVAAGGAKVVVTTQLQFSGSGFLDLRDNDLVVDYLPLSPSPIGTWNGSAYTGLSALVRSGYNGGANNGPGIRTSLGTMNTLIAIAEADDVLPVSATQTALWSGQTVDGSAVLLKYTYGGDCNLDGKINIDDYGLIDFNVNSSGIIFAYYNGDLNLDGKINIDDYGMIDFNVGSQDDPL